MKKVIGLMIVMFVLRVSVGALTLCGSGTLDAPYLIGTTDEFRAFAAIVGTGGQTDACARLACDIDFTGEVYTSVGTPQKPYAGRFDGAGFRIRGALVGPCMSTDGSECVMALFGAVKDAVITDVHVDDCTVLFDDPSYRSNLYAGVLVGKGCGTLTVERCDVSDAVLSLRSSAKTSLGGLIGGFDGGTFHGSLTVCDSRVYRARIDASSSRFLFAGGLIGQADIVGADAALMIRRCVSDTVISAHGTSFTYVGGIGADITYEPDWQGAALSEDNAQLFDSLVRTEIDAIGLETYIGGLCGYANGVLAKNCHVCGSLPSSTVGALGGKAVSMTDCAFFADTLGFDFSVWRMTDDLPTLAAGTPEEYTAVYRDETVSVRVSDAYDIPPCTLILALYDGEGRLTHTHILPAYTRLASYAYQTDAPPSVLCCFFLDGCTPTRTAVRTAIKLNRRFFTNSGIQHPKSMPQRFGADDLYE